MMSKCELEEAGRQGRGREREEQNHVKADQEAGKETEQALWLYTFSTLLDHLPSSSMRYSWEEKNRPPPPPSPSSDALVRASLNRIAELFDETCPPPVQALVIGELSLRLLLCMCSKFSTSSSPEAWKGAVEAFMAVCR
eukprot:732325-Hanusia_phi.AAC.1